MKKQQIKKSSQPKPFNRKTIQFNKAPKPFKYYNILGVAIILILGIIIYSNSFNCSFNFDDTNSIVGNKAIQNLSDIKTWWNYSSNRPIAYFTFALNYHFGQLNVWGYHLVNLIIHLITSCIVGWLTLLIFSTPAMKDNPIIKHKKTLAFFVALLFVSHPLATQSVTYIIQRLASLVAMFYLLSLSLYVKGRLSEKGITKYIWFAGAFVSAVLALLTKENAYTLPFAILLFDIFFLQTKKRKINFKDYRFVILFCGFVIFLVLLFYKYSAYIFKSLPPTGGHNYVITTVNYLFTQFSVITKYIQLLFLPIHQNLDYDFPISNSFFEPRTILSFFSLLSLIGLAVFLFKRNRIISFAIFWFFLTLSIESSIIPIDDLIFEHRTYLPSFGFFLILIISIYSLIWNKYKYLGLSILLIIIGCNSLLTFNRNNVWKDDFSLWNDAVLKSPNKARPYYNRGVIFSDNKKYNQALNDYSKAIEINPNYLSAYYNRGIAYDNLGQWNNAITDYTRAIEINSKYLLAYYNRGIAYGNLGQWNIAIADYTKAIEIDSNNKEAYSNRGNVFGTLGQFDKAIANYTSAIEIDPKFKDAYYNRGIAFTSIKLWKNAIADYSKVIEIDPNNTSAYSNRGIAFANLGQYQNAISDYSKAIEIDPNYIIAYNNRGYAYIKLEEWDKAISDYTKTLEINPDDKLAFSNREYAYSKLKPSPK